MAKPTTLYLRTRDGRTVALTGRRLAKLYRAVVSGAGGAELACYADDHEGFLGPNGEVWDLDTLPVAWAAK